MFCENSASKETLVARSSHRRCSVRKNVLWNFAKFTGKHLYQSLFFNKIVGLRPATLLKKRLWHRCFPMNFAMFLRTPFLQNSSGRLLLCGKNCYYLQRQSDLQFSPMFLVPFSSFWSLSLCHREVEFLIFFMSVFLLLTIIILPCFIDKDVLIRAFWNEIKPRVNLILKWNKITSRLSYFVVWRKITLSDNFWDMYPLTTTRDKKYDQKLFEIVSRSFSEGISGIIKLG